MVVFDTKPQQLYMFCQIEKFTGASFSFIEDDILNSRALMSET